MNKSINPLPIRLEDNFEDILQKAAKGLGYEKLDLMEKSGLSMLEIESLLRGKFNPTPLYTLAKTLHLNPEALIQIGAGNYYPKVTLIEGLFPINVPFPIPGYEEMTVNSFAVHIPSESNIVVFDLSGNFPVITNLIKEKKGDIKAIFLTHGHRDHIMDLGKFAQSFPDVPIYANSLEKIPNTIAIEDGQTWSWNKFKITSYKTPGHSIGGTSFYLEGLSLPICFVGDAIFSGSIGGIPIQYEKHLSNLDQFLGSLPSETILAPGHGPCSTVAKETEANPFFAKS